MPEMSTAPHVTDPHRGQYTVVARRYRPQSFEDLVGQQQVSRALSNAINTNRVGHAYLFTGARGVGKTSTARILAKCLNCVQGPTPEPCGVCDICSSIATGDDVDVLEIDGASNNGIDEIRQLRSNVSVRPSRSRFKIYIIDEVHMLSKSAFNGLLKTLEEPPEHVKFIFCTTDPEKIPITVLSRCQRFDFPPVASDAILCRLQDIVQTEGVQAEEAALRLLARRAGGSMRDSQSLLEQLLSFCGDVITERDVHAMLGTASGGRVLELMGHLIARNAAAALQELDAAVRDGVDVGQLAEQLLGCLRDMMAAQVGCDADLMLYSAAPDHPALKQAADSWGLETLLAAVQILDQAIVRMRLSTQVRTLIEIALVRICNLEDLDAIGDLVAQLQGSSPAGQRPAPNRPTAARSASSGGAQKKKTLSDAAEGAATSVPSSTSAPVATSSAPPSSTSHASAADASATDAPIGRPVELAEHNVQETWCAALDEIGGLTAECAGNFDSLAISAPNLLVVRLKTAYNKDWCERADIKRRLEQVMSRLAGREMRIDFAATAEPAPVRQAARPTAQSRLQRMREAEQNPLVQEAISLFDAEIVRVDPRRRS
jgi:DNA polymerase-3 subunit gamma/tau